MLISAKRDAKLRTILHHEPTSEIFRLLNYGGCIIDQLYNDSHRFSSPGIVEQIAAEYWTRIT